VIPHIVFILFFFALGACVGSFLNVVVWRLPRGESLVRPGSHCPKCNHPLAWRDNIPVFGWIFLRGKCRYCGNQISPRYPIVEAITGLLFVGYYVCFFVLQIGPCAQQSNRVDEFGMALPSLLSLQQHWPIYLLYMFLIAALLAASLIDAELFIIPPSIPWWCAGVGLVVHAIIDDRRMPGAINTSPPGAALAAGGFVGLLISLALLWKGILPISFPEGTPDLEIDKKRREENQSESANEPPPREYSRGEVRAEMSKEMLFLIPPLLLGGLWVLATLKIPALSHFWNGVVSHDWVSGLLGSVLGGLVGGFAVWFTRILGSLFFGREAMGLGDVDLMLGVGAVLGPGAAVIAFFLAPFCGIGVAAYRLIFRRGHEIPYGPYLSMGTALVMIFYCPIAAYFAPGLAFLGTMLRNLIGV
jgi:leader peptidase (prepilin peptidase)/N-methyltransferase